MIKLEGHSGRGHRNETREIDFISKQFEGGEEHVRIIAPDPDLFSYTITCLFPTSEELMQIVLLVNALRNINPKSQIKLTLPYMPYGRQDRACATGEPSSLVAICSILKGLRVTVETWDDHSYVIDALLSPFHKHISQLDCIKSLAVSQTGLAQLLATGCTIVAPDAGSAKKAADIAEHFALPLLVAYKLRDPVTGEPTVCIPPHDTDGDTEYLIVDDICDGGRTFLSLADKLQSNNLYLYVTHGIFSHNAKTRLLQRFAGVFAATDKDTRSTNMSFA